VATPAAGEDAGCSTFTASHPLPPGYGQSVATGTTAINTTDKPVSVKWRCLLSRRSPSDPTALVCCRLCTPPGRPRTGSTKSAMQRLGGSL